MKVFRILVIGLKILMIFELKKSDAIHSSSIGRFLHEERQQDRLLNEERQRDTCPGIADGQIYDIWDEKGNVIDKKQKCGTALHKECSYYEKCRTPIGKPFRYDCGGGFFIIKFRYVWKWKKKTGKCVDNSEKGCICECEEKRKLQDGQNPTDKLCECSPPEEVCPAIKTPSPTTTPYTPSVPTVSPTAPLPPPPPPPPPKPPTNETLPPREDYDPHFRTFQEYYYDYHGGCDLVLIHSKLIDIHIHTEVRTTSFGRVWSGVDKFALRVRDDTFELHADPFRVFYNGQNVELNPDLLTQLAQRYRFFVDRPRFYLNGGEEYIEVRRHDGTDKTFSIILSAHISTILDAVGMFGTRTDTGNGMLGRDGSTRYYRYSADGFGEEWQVDPAKGDPTLFMDPGEPNCVYARRTLEDEQIDEAELQESAELQELAEQSCDFLHTVEDGNKYRNCLFDVSVTGDPTWAEAPLYTEDEPKYEFLGQCISDGDECKQKGGECEWRCNANENTCLTSMCRGKSGFDEYSGEELQGGFVDGCSCALPLDYVVPPDSDNKGCGLFGIFELLGLCFILNFFQNLWDDFLSLF